jgi:hypothetical protein
MSDDPRPIWKRPRPAGAGKKSPLTPHQREAARQRAKAAGRRYPNLVDNLWATRHVAREPGDVIRDDSPLVPDS